MNQREHDEKYALESLRNAMDYQRHPEREGYHKVLLYALKLTNISGDWAWYEKVKRRKVPSIKAYKKFLEDEVVKSE